MRIFAVSVACLLWATSASAADKSKVLVQDLVAQGVAAHEAAVVSSAACQAFSKHASYEVLCGEDIRNMMRFGALSAAFDACNDASCYANMGRAAKARFVVSGSVSKLGETYVLTLSMFDTVDGRPVGRTEVKADSIEKLHLQVPEATIVAKR